MSWNPRRRLIALHWQDITPEEAAKQEIDLREHPELSPPINEMGEICPWPWEPQQLTGQPIGQYHCPYCGSMVIAGIPHLDYREQP